MHGGEDQLSEMGAEARVERESISNYDQLEKIEESIIRPNRLPMEISSVGEMDFQVKYSIVNMMESCFENRLEVNRAILVGLKIQDGDKIYTQLRDYDDFRGFIFTERNRYGCDFEAQLRRILGTLMVNI